MTRRTVLLVVGLAVVAFLVALPVVAAEPSPGDGRSHERTKEKADTSTITLSGTVTAVAGAEGRTIYTLRSGGTTYTLDAGPSWFFGSRHPLEPFVGKTVRIVGEKAAYSIEVEVITVNGTTLRSTGRPSWAGGWKRVGERHPGWSEQKAHRHTVKFGSCFPPGHCKEKIADHHPKPTPAP